ncbi:hypothetical protein A3C26_02955 [Candidatus Daviesbacteria bacterium RIFCSPHIGHO2_02_FULL_39_12]|uniref:Pilus assembly protein PilO n=2 Tax=Candidatus Daviesiibacteriota TaxID=1752718 RepID=A0A1F5JDW7_9BACT|nr:MAG: hypothetical protein A3C26_02955 [Candidatus Daviesbacteria bacterium RIFCSPHIGHO2_02_FULL_39_12]OGE71457.1 MAG: hypothetical protein A3H40_02930 [Candidatus Daviesbacteria bacterium RIFCSPLOWO2_02_FULL_38_15]
MRLGSQIYTRYFTYIKPFGKLPIVKTYGAAIFTLFTMTVFIIFAVKPTVETILVLQKKLADSKQVLEKVNKKANDLSLGKQKLENLNADVKSEIASAIPDTVQLKSVIRNLEQMAKNRDASISALQFQPLNLETKAEEKTGTIAEITFNFNVEGDYKNLVLLLQELKTSDRLISIDHLSLSKVNEGNKLIMAITGKAYFLK